jgi:hypothetical protein
MNRDNLTKRERMIYDTAYEDGYQQGLHDGIIAALRNAAKPAPKRIIAAGATGPDLPSLKRRPNHAFDEDDTAVLEILSGPTKWEQEEADIETTQGSLLMGTGRV